MHKTSFLPNVDLNDKHNMIMIIDILSKPNICDNSSLENKKVKFFIKYQYKSTTKEKIN